MSLELQHKRDVLSFMLTLFPHVIILRSRMIIIPTQVGGFTMQFRISFSNTIQLSLNVLQLELLVA